MLLWATVGVGGAAPRTEEEDTAPYREQLREGWRFLRGDRVLLGIAVMVALTNLLDIAWAAGAGAGLGAGVRRRRGRDRPALRGLRRGVGLGALCAAAWGETMPRYRTYLVAFLDRRGCRGSW